MFGRKRELLNAWKKVRHGCELNDFLAVAASERGWDIQWMISVITEFEKKEHSKQSLSYSPGGIASHFATPTNQPIPTEVYQGDVVGETAQLKTHLLLVTETGAGKSTFLKAVLHRIIQTRSSAQFFICDPKTTDWLHLQRLPGVVTYLTGTDEQQIAAAESHVSQVFEILLARKDAIQQVLMQGGQAPESHPVFLIFDEWFSFYDKLKRLKRLDPLKGWFNELVAQGRELDVHCILVSQSPDVDEIGFSSSMRRCFEFVCLSCAEVGFESISATINRPAIFSAKTERDRLAAALHQAIQIAGQQRVALTTLGTPKIALLPDLSWVHGVAVELPDNFHSQSPAPGAGSMLNQSQRLPNQRFHAKTDSLPTTPATGKSDLSGYRPLYKAVSILQGMGVSETRLVEEVMGFKGRRFAEGQVALQALLRLGLEQGW